MREGLIQFLDRLQANGYKATEKRSVILQHLIDHKEKHLSADDLYKLVGNDEKDVGLATIYRSLDVFEKAGIIQHILFDGDCKRYHLTNYPERQKHYHLVCEVCGRIMDVHQDVIEVLKEDIYLEKKFIITDQKVQIYGVCELCEAARQNEINDAREKNDKNK